MYGSSPLLSSLYAVDCEWANGDVVVIGHGPVGSTLWSSRRWMIWWSGEISRSRCWIWLEHYIEMFVPQHTKPCTVVADNPFFNIGHRKTCSTVGYLMRSHLFLFTFDANMSLFGENMLEVLTAQSHHQKNGIGNTNVVAWLLSIVISVISQHSGVCVPDVPKKTAAAVSVKQSRKVVSNLASCVLLFDFDCTRRYAHSPVTFYVKRLSFPTEF